MNNEKEEGIFHFDDDSEDYGFVLPPEYKISQDRPYHESASGDENHGQMEAEDVQGRRVSFDTEKNEYYYVERCSDQEMCSEVDEELRPKEFEIEMPLGQDLERDRADVQGAEDAVGGVPVEQTGVLVDTSVQSRKPFLETSSDAREDDTLGESPLCQTVDDGEAGRGEESQSESNLAEMAGDRPLLANDDCPLCPRDGQVVRESLPRIKENPFILRDQMNLK